ncbi:cadherin-23-like [Haliotis rubra]|uniref:cadherin-23-like n=1 Tax=Haliotis rubra TaxID=36100 RepID=UPI001EE54F64|nr:cadherin-23-like [Haliotis rubra]
MVDPVTGVVSVRRNLETDTSDTSVYRFIVDAIDGSGVRAPQPANVDITVDRNLFPPVFITTNYTAVINNTTPQGSPVFTALATDGDSTSPFNVVQYSIIGDDGSQSFFSVDATSGAVSLAQPVFNIPNTQFRVRLQAVDGSGLTDVEVLTVFIQRNLFAPVFTQALYERVIQETIPVSTSILNVFAQDSDQTAPYSTVSYFASGSSDRFLVNVNNGAVTVRRSLIGESGQTFTFQVYAQDGGTPPLRSQFVTVRINVTRNNFPPVFVNEPYSQSLLATASAGDGVVQVTATDADVEFPFNNVRYDIIGDDNAPAIFQIDESSGQISLRNTFSGDGAELYRIRVRARDGGNPRLSDITVVSVNVTRNLRAPVFNTPTYSARILETINFGEVFISATAQDLDTSAPNNALTYQPTGNIECQRYFGINNNGGLYVQADLVTDPTRATFYTCQVSAQDQGNPRRDSTNQATVSINVIRNTAPEFTNLPYEAVLQKNVTTGTVVGTFTVTDSDTDAPFNERNFRILGDGNAPALFNLNGNNVVVTSATDLAADTTTSYTVRLEVRDGGRSALSGTAVMDIQVIRNLATPVFSNSFIERNINENYPVGGLITILNATDSDPQAPNNVLIYLALNPSSTDYLYVNPINGAVRTQRSFIGSTVRQYDFLVRVQDGGSPPKTAVATVRVNVARDSQTLAFRQDNYVFTIVENTPATSSIINLEAIPGPDVIYRLTGYSDSGDYFRVNPNNGEITLIKDLATDVSRRPTFYLQVEAEKQFTVNLQKAIANVTITVQRNTNGPIFNETDSIYEVIIDETRALGSTILQLYAPDADGDTVRYEVINYQAGETDFLYLGPFSGLIRVAKPLTSTNTRRFEFTVRARDGMNPERSSTATVIVNVRGDNQPPAFINEPYNSRLNFSDPVGTRVFIVQGTDPDLIGQMNYELTGQYLSAPAFFRVDRTTGEVFLSSSISTESTSTYTLGLSTFDSARPTRRDFTNLTITVNQNPNAPAFTTFSYDRTISETNDLGVSVIQIEASDPDGQILSYTVEAANPTDCDSFFLLGASGLIVASRALTTSSFPQCTMTVRIRDNGVPVRQSVGLATATIRIDRNNNAPVFGGGPYTRTIPETQNIGFIVFQFQASDADQPNTEFSRLEYSLIGDDNTGNFFEINSQTGVFTVRSQLDRNDIDRYVPRVVVKDGGSPSKSATVTGIVNILRNLNDPVFNPTFYNATIFETHALRDSIVRVVATDADRSGPQSTFTFSLQDLSRNFASTYFRIDTTSGNIFARLPLTQDLTDTSFVEFSVTATDQGVPVQISVPPARVRVNIIRNLNPPCLPE